MAFSIGTSLLASAALGAQATGVSSPEEVVLASGSGSYVCTPAGFGKKSRCYRR
ncbi:hypothetical protein EPIB1_2030 [Tritonibacter mobilis]|nr:hypothetical protein EPIB1_2030 [Tritonibacter mobilis]